MSSSTTLSALPTADAAPPPPPARWLGEVRYWTYAVHLVAIGALAISNAALALAMLIAPWRRGLRQVARAAAPLLVPLGVYVLFLVVSVSFSYEPVVSARRLTELFSIATLLLALLLVRGERRVRYIVDGLTLVAAGLAAWGLAQYLEGYGDLHRRIRGPFSHYMTFAGVLLLADVMLIVRLTFPGRRQRWRFVALALINLAVVGSLTRSAWVALAVAATVLVALRAPRSLPVWAPLLLVAALLAPPAVRARAASIVDLEDASNYDRLCMANAALYMIAERPLFGIGPYLVKLRYPIYRHPTAPRYSVPHLHSSLLQLTAERGLLSLAAYLWLMLAAALQAWRRYRVEGGAHGPRADLYLGVALALLAFNVAGLFEDNWGDTEVQRLMLWLLAIPFCLVLPEEEK